MAIKKIYQCKPCNYQYEHLDFGVPVSLQKPIPPCPLCSNNLIYDEPDITEDSPYKCWLSDKGCGVEFILETPKGNVPSTYPCPMCGVTAKLQIKMAILHGKGSEKGASLDVVIGRSANERWNKIYDRKSARDKFRKEIGSEALSITEKNGEVYAKPIPAAKLKSVITKK